MVTAVPFSLIVTLGFFFFLDISLNILSMMGLMLAIGMLVDNAVVVTENIHRYQRKGTDPQKASLLGAKEVSIAVTAGTLTSIIVFLPNVVNESFIPQHMYYIGMAIIISMLAWFKADNRCIVPASWIVNLEWNQIKIKAVL